MRSKFFWIMIFVATVLFGALLFFLSRNNNGTVENTVVNTTQAYKSCIKNFSVELCGMYSTEGRARLYETCSNLVIPKTERDTTLYTDNKLVVARWRDNVSQEDVTAYLPYEPGTGFVGCSESVKELLGHIQETGPK